jgi:hypothetical protein
MNFENEMENAYLEGYYQAINDLKVDDVFDNFENKYGKDDTTELTTFKDMSQKDACPAMGHKRANLFLAIKNRDEQNPKMKKNFYKSNDYLDEEETCDEISDLSKPNANNLDNKKDKKILNHYVKFHEEEIDNAFLEGYYDAMEALNEATKGEKIAMGTLAAGTAGLIGLAARSIHKKRKYENDLNYRKEVNAKRAAKKEAKNKKKYSKYKGELSYEEWKDPTNREYEKYKADGGKLSKEEYFKAKARRERAEKILRAQQAKARREREERE